MSERGRRYARYVTYTIKNLRDVEDVAPKSGFDAIQEARFPRRDLEAADTGLAYHRVKPGQRGFGHRHENAEEIYVVVGGSGRIKLDDEVKEIGELDAIRVAPAVVRAFEAGPDGLELLVFGPHHEGDGEVIRDDVGGG
jgi:quercetin dioxygenase-like cupin family protein